MAKVERVEKPDKSPDLLRRGWTTGACATAATKAALTALITGEFPDPVSIRLPKGEEPAFALALEELGDGFARAGIVKDAGDDPDVTHGATLISRISRGEPGSGIRFVAGPGVGTVTKPGLPLDVDEPAINPVPRKMMCQVVETLCKAHHLPADIDIEISVPDGEEIARHTWNPRLGIIGGISILGTTGVVHPFSCSAWIHSIHRGVDVCRASGTRHALAATGSTSEAAAQALYDLPEHALLDMGDFAGGLLKYLREHPIERITIAGGFAKLSKLAAGALDLHSGRSQVNMNWLSKQAGELGLGDAQLNQILNSNTAMQALEITYASGIDLAAAIAQKAKTAALEVLRGAPVDVEIVVVNRQGKIIARAGFGT